MAGETKINGDVLILQAWDSDASAYKPIACITSNELSSTAEIIESKTKCAPGVISKDYGSINKSISIDGEYIDTTSAGGETTKASHDWLEEKQDAKEKIDIAIGTGLDDVPTKYAKALISDIVLTGPAGSISTFSATLDIDGGYIADPHAA